MLCVTASVGVCCFSGSCGGSAWHLPGQPNLCNDWGPVVGQHLLWESWFTDVSSATQTGWSRLSAVCVSCVPGVLGGWMPFPESQGQEHYLHLIVAA